ncbi:acetyl-CoA C-acetyltransferase [Vibrio cholerae]|uniref:acetyl-CoA C-acetyltransferase n=1 Tax=Vibrio cholerae TaxID=666 RepID=UPI0011ED28F5|nr:acetyl-CoA C-acetyltransferase [Vibrio cholerae]TYW43603.1 acetyl-CoA C-acetyltransferase [Vibrio cholerae]TYW53123.1 acetyl-CoA C-acetyltransferase [Vibrio cholerae]
MEKIYIVGAKRSAIGAFGGSLKECSAGALAGQVIQAALEAAQVKPEAVDEVIVGNVVSAGQGMGVGRQAALVAGVPQSVPAYSINMVCGSGMKSVMDAVAHIKAGDASVVVAAGVEVMSQIPFVTPASLRDGQKMGAFEVKDLLIHDGLTDVFNQYHMGVTAENIAKQYDIARQTQDEFALASQMKATAAIEAGHFKREIVPISVKKRRETVVFDTDEYPKPTTTLVALQGLRAAFDAQGTVTAGNASGINDGASAVIIASESAVKKLGLTPIAEIMSYAQTGLDPKVMGLGPVSAVTQALAKAELSITQVDLFELNEAFAAQALGVVYGLAEQHAIQPEAILEKANVNGGAIALGHPLGASGNRILVTLLHELQRRQKHYGVASLCVGGGMGTAIVIKTV